MDSAFAAMKKQKSGLYTGEKLLYFIQFENCSLENAIFMEQELPFLHLDAGEILMRLLHFI